jgi:hypothetical protein
MSVREPPNDHVEASKQQQRAPINTRHANKKKSRALAVAVQPPLTRWLIRSQDKRTNRRSIT